MSMDRSTILTRKGYNVQSFIEHWSLTSAINICWFANWVWMEAFQKMHASPQPKFTMHLFSYMSWSSFLLKRKMNKLWLRPTPVVPKLRVGTHQCVATWFLVDYETDKLIASKAYVLSPKETEEEQHVCVGPMSRQACLGSILRADWQECNAIRMVPVWWTYSPTNLQEGSPPAKLTRKNIEPYGKQNRAKCLCLLVSKQTYFSSYWRPGEGSQVKAASMVPINEHRAQPTLQKTALLCAHRR